MIKKIKELVKFAVHYINNSSVWKKISSTVVYQLLVSFRNKVEASILLFSLLILWGTVSLAISRYFYMWWFDKWEYLTLYYYSISASALFSLILITLHYMRIKGVSDRMARNSKRWDIYYSELIESYNISYLFSIKKYSGFLILLSSIFVSINPSVGYGISGLFFLAWGFSRVAIAYYIFKTPIPSELLLEPPAFFERICQKPTINKILVRRYSSRKASSIFFTASERNWKIILLSVSAGASAFYGLDSTLANLKGESLYLTRLYDYNKHGWYTDKLDVRSRMLVLLDLGYNSSDFVKNGRLDPLMVHRAYNEWESGFKERENLFEKLLKIQDQQIKGQKIEIDSLSKRLEVFEKKEISSK